MTELERLKKDLECKMAWYDHFIEANDAVSARKTEMRIKEIKEQIKRLSYGY